MNFDILPESLSQQSLDLLSQQERADLSVSFVSHVLAKVDKQMSNLSLADFASIRTKIGDGGNPCVTVILSGNIASHVIGDPTFQMVFSPSDAGSETGSLGMIFGMKVFSDVFLPTPVIKPGYIIMLTTPSRLQASYQDGVWTVNDAGVSVCQVLDL